MGDRRGGDAGKSLLGSGIAHHLHDLHRGRTADDGVVDEYDPLAGDDCAIGAVFEADPELADLLARLNERAPDIVVADDAELVGNARLLGVADGRPRAGIANRDPPPRAAPPLPRNPRP